MYDNILKRLQKKEIVLPWVENAFMSDKWPDKYTIEVDSSPYYGHGDGYFHPSTHPLMSPRQLYYLFHPEHRKKMITERRNLQSHMTLSMGSALHATVQTQLIMSGLATQEDMEVEYVIHDHHVRGRIDAMLRDHPDGNTYALEFKSLACSTPILTTHGWSTMGELRDGDEVFAPDGQPTKVLKAHPINLGRTCYRVTFRDGQSVVTDGEHLWQVWDRSLRRNRVMTTAEIRGARWGRAYRFAVPVTGPLQTQEADLPIDPWLLGMWLGDGSRDAVDICAGEDDLPYLLGRLDDLGLSHRVYRYSGRAPRVYVHGLRDVFAGLGLLEHNRTGLVGTKHIPAIYLTASESQRRALLAGLMDSDGTVGDHQAAIGMNRPDLMRQVLQLVRSLGYRATYTEHNSSLEGRDCGPISWVKFSAAWGESPFAMPRKQECWDSKPKNSIQNLRRNAITSIEEVDTVPVRCITVAHESALYVAGEGFLTTHNTQNGFGFDKQEDPKPEWDIQLSLGEYSQGITKGVILVMESGFPYRLKEYPHTRNDNKLDEVFSKFDDVRRRIKANDPPRHCCNYQSPEMSSCFARHACWLGEL